MLRRLTPFIVAASLCLGGCLESRETVTLRRDGGGSLEQTYLLDREARDRLVAIAVARVSGSSEPIPEMPFANPICPAWIRAAAEGVKGYSIRTLESETTPERITTRVSATFERLEDAALAGAFLTTSVQLDRVSMDAWRLVFEEQWRRATAASGGEIAGVPAAEALAAVADALRGLRWTRTITLPGRVRETDGALGADGRTVTWTVDLDALRSGEGLALHAEFEASDEDHLEPFRHMPDLERTVHRFLEAPPPGAEEIPDAPPAEPPPAAPDEEPGR